MNNQTLVFSFAIVYNIHKFNTGNMITVEALLSCLMGKDYLREKSAEKRGSNSINGRVVR
jgi:hypothetical protein